MCQNVNIIVYIWSPNLAICATAKIGGCTRLIPSLACRSSVHWWVIRQLDPTNPADHSTIVTTQSVKGVGSHGPSFCTMWHWTTYIRAKQTTPQVERHRLGREQRKFFSKLTPGTPASSSGSSHTATTSTEHVTQVAEMINYCLKYL